METELLQLFAKTFDLAPERLQMDATLQDLGLDSLVVIEFLFEVEDKFGISLPDQAPPPRTLGELVAMITALQPQK